MPTTRMATVGPVEAFWRFKIGNLIACVLVAALAAIAAYLLGGTFSATTTLYLTDPRGVPVFRDGTTAPTDLASYAEQRASFAQSDAVLVDVAGRLGFGQTVAQLRDDVQTSVTASSNVKLTCRRDAAAQAAALCAEVAGAYANLSRLEVDRRAQVVVDELAAARQRLLDELNVAQSSGESALTSGAIEQIDVQIAQTLTKSALFDSGVEFVDAPEVHGSSRLVPAVQYGLAAFAFALLLAGALSWMLAMRRPVVTDPDLAALALGVPLLGQITDSGPGASYELLATNLASIARSGVVVVTGTVGSVEYAEMLANVAEAWTRDGRRVLVIDGNVHRPRLSKRFGIDLGSAGIAALLGGSVSDDAAIRKVTLTERGPVVDFVASGRPTKHTASVLRSMTAREVLIHLREIYDVVLIDAPPLMDSAEGSALASCADGVVMVVPSGMPTNELGALHRRLDVLQAPVLGVIYVTEPR